MADSTANQSNLKIENLFNVKDWVAVVTGGGTGIGLMITQALANNGARVYIVGRRKEVLETTVEKYGRNLAHPSGRIVGIAGDVTDKAALAQIVAEVGRREKHVHLLVNNAGIMSGPTTEVEKGDTSAQALSDALWAESVADWEAVYRTNVISYFFTAAAFVPLLAAARADTPGVSSSIVNISSISGITRQTQHQYKYNVSKAATIHLTTLLAQELARQAVRVRVNSVAPGVFPSEMTTDGSDAANKSYMDAEGWREEKQVPAGRPGKDEDVAQAVLHFAVNQYANAQTVAIDGGYLLTHP